MKFAGIARFIAAALYCVAALVVIGHLAHQFLGSTGLSVRFPIFIAAPLAYSVNWVRRAVVVLLSISSFALAVAFLIDIETYSANAPPLFSEVFFAGIAFLTVVPAIGIIGWQLSPYSRAGRARLTAKSPSALNRIADGQ